MQEEARQVLAGAIVEAIETGNPIAPLEPALRPAGLAEGEAVAEAVLDALGQAPCGLRLLRGAGGGWLAGPLLPGRLLADGAVIAWSALRRPRVSAGILGVLAEALEPGADTPPRFARLHAALDLASSRFRDGAADEAHSVADLADLGYVVTGRPGALPAGPVAVSCAPGAKRPRGSAEDLAAGFAAAAAAARRLGGLPAGAVLMLAGLGAASVPAAGERWTARVAGLGRAQALIGEASSGEDAPAA
ncbi:hypothetical protein FHS88_002636 [Roseomonas alkaliterrae]|uniref:4-oxalocrotonate decarboxylase n=1 Tax=Neoroseomonas alkaliterrae TaxID=1452450 RepID=A0A840Y3C6_9PROT|nr:hypothetical protein [Neoroseomonas alkaliterrae]MBB5690501.1 hypothetical protein [Neoroseomonas alkaliterrae]